MMAKIGMAVLVFGICGLAGVLVVSCIRAELRRADRESIEWAQVEAQRIKGCQDKGGITLLNRSGDYNGCQVPPPR